MNILFFSTVFFPVVGGAQVTLHELATRLSKDHKVYLILPLGSYIRCFRVCRNLNYTVLPYLPFRFIKYAANGNYFSKKLFYFYFTIIFKILKVDLVQSFYVYPNGYLVNDVCKAHRIPHFTRTVGDDIQVNKQLNYGLMRDKSNLNLSTYFSGTSTKFLSLSSSVDSDLINLGVQTDNIVRFPCGVDTDFFRSVEISEFERQRFRNQLGVSDHEFLFISVGRAHPKKGFDVILRAAKSLLDEGMKFKVLFVGPGFENLRKLAEELSIEKSIIFYGAIIPIPTDEYKMPNSDLVKLYKISDACLFPSLLETFALIYIEAMAAKIPVIASNAAGCGEIVEDEKNALVANAGDELSLSEKMKLLMSSKKLQETLIKNGYKLVLEKYDWKILVMKITKHYKENLIARGKK